LALLNSYRATRGRDDGLFLRFGGLDDSSLQMGLAALLEATRQASV
jgi:hypothetical protein